MNETQKKQIPLRLSPKLYAAIDEPIQLDIQ